MHWAKKGVKLSDIFMNSMLFPYPESEQLNAEHDILTNMYHNSLCQTVTGTPDYKVHKRLKLKRQRHIIRHFNPWNVLISNM